MPDGYSRVRSGEKRPLYGQVTASTGTLAIQASPAPVCTLYDEDGIAVPGFSAIAVTGYDAGAQTAPRAWLLLDSALLDAGFYTLVFKFTAFGSDGLSRVYEPSLEVEVAGVVE